MAAPVAVSTIFQTMLDRFDITFISGIVSSHSMPSSVSAWCIECASLVVQALMVHSGRIGMMGHRVRSLARRVMRPVAVALRPCPWSPCPLRSRPQNPSRRSPYPSPPMSIEPMSIEPMSIEPMSIPLMSISPMNCRVLSGGRSTVSGERSAFGFELGSVRSTR